MSGISNLQNDNLLKEEIINDIFKKIDLSTPSTARFKIIYSTGNEILAKIDQLFQDKLDLSIGRKSSLFSLESDDSIRFTLLEETPAHITACYESLRESLLKSKKRRSVPCSAHTSSSAKAVAIGHQYTLTYEAQKGLGKSHPYARGFARSKAYDGKTDAIAQQYALAIEAQIELGKSDPYAVGFAKSKTYDGKTDTIAHQYALAYEAQKGLGKSDLYARGFARSKAYDGKTDAIAQQYALAIEAQKDLESRIHMLEVLPDLKPMMVKQMLSLSNML